MSDANTWFQYNSKVQITRSILLLYLFSSLQGFAQERLELLSKTYSKAANTLFRNVQGPVDPSYEFDMRSPEQALSDGLGGSCKVHARVAALTLMNNGVAP